jgi:hypothetical protein
MKESHAGMNLTDAHFAAIVEDLVTALDAPGSSPPTGTSWSACSAASRVTSSGSDPRRRRAPRYSRGVISVCVFLASSQGHDPRYAEVARATAPRSPRAAGAWSTAARTAA